MLQYQANSNAREGRVMIYNLVEAAQEFLSEIPPVRQLHESVSLAYEIIYTCLRRQELEDVTTIYTSTCDAHLNNKFLI